MPPSRGIAILWRRAAWTSGLWKVMPLLALMSCQSVDGTAAGIRPLADIPELAGSVPRPSPAVYGLYLANFEQVVFGAEFGPSRTILHRWPRVVRIRVVGEVGGEIGGATRETVRGVADLLTRISGLEVSIVAGAAANFTLYLISAAEFAAAFAAEIAPDARRLPLVRCFGYLRVDKQRGGILRGAAFIDSALDRATLEACLTEELAQGLGLPNDTFLVAESVFNDGNRLDRLSYHDAILMRALYDPRVRSGMTRAAVMQAMETIIPDLIDGLNRAADP